MPDGKTPGAFDVAKQWLADKLPVKSKAEIGSQFPAGSEVILDPNDLELMAVGDDKTLISIDKKSSRMKGGLLTNHICRIVDVTRAYQYDAGDGSQTWEATDKDGKKVLFRTGKDQDFYQMAVSISQRAYNILHHIDTTDQRGGQQTSRQAARSHQELRPEDLPSEIAVIADQNAAETAAKRLSPAQSAIVALDALRASIAQTSASVATTGGEYPAGQGRSALNTNANEIRSAVAPDAEFKIIPDAMRPLTMTDILSNPATEQKVQDYLTVLADSRKQDESFIAINGDTLTLSIGRSTDGLRVIKMHNFSDPDHYVQLRETTVGVWQADPLYIDKSGVDKDKGPGEFLIENLDPVRRMLAQINRHASSVQSP